MHLDGPEFVRDNRQYKSVTIPAASFNRTTHEYTIPASYIDGEVRIEGLFTPGETPDPGNNDQTFTVTYKNGADGTFYQNGSEVAIGQGWKAAEWVSAEPAPIVTISNKRSDNSYGTNGFNTTAYHLASDRIFTISVEDPFLITGYRIYTADGWGAVVTTENGESETFSGEATLIVSGLNTKSTSFTTSPSPAANLNSPIIDIYIVDSSAVGVGEIRSTTGRVVGYYSIDGKRLPQTPAKGLYIMDGKKVVKK